MSILYDLLSELHMDARVRTVLVGAHWTVVCSRHCGMAATLMDDHAHGHSQVRDVGHLHSKTACQLADYAHSETCWKQVLVWRRSIRCWMWMKARQLK